MFLSKDILSKANTCLHLSKIHFKDRVIQHHEQDGYPEISVKVELADLKKNDKASDKQIVKFKLDIVLFLSALCSHLAEKSVIKLPHDKKFKVFYPNFTC